MPPDLAASPFLIAAIVFGALGAILRFPDGREMPLIPVTRPAELEVRVSTTGLLLREAKLGNR